MFPILFHVNDIEVTAFGVARLLSYLAAAALLVVTARRLEQPMLVAVRAAVALYLGGLAGGRLGFILFNLDAPWTVGGLLTTSGFVYTTAILGALAAVLILALVQQRGIGNPFDLVAPSVVGAWAVGNIGCFLTGCCLGPPTNVPWALTFVSKITPPELRGVPVHPMPLYSLAIEVAILGLLFAFPRRFKGELFLRAVAGLLTMRVVYFALGLGSSFSVIAFVQALLIALAVSLLIYFRRRDRSAETSIANTPSAAGA